MGRDNGLNVHRAREQIIYLCKGEQINFIISKILDLEFIRHSNRYY